MYKLAEWGSGSVSALPCERPGFASRTRLRETSRGLMQGINMEKSSQGCYKAIQIGFCDSYHNIIIDIQNSLPYSKVVYPAIIVLFSCLMEVNHGAGSRPNDPFR